MMPGGHVHQTKAPTVLHAFGNKASPRAPRNSDVELDPSNNLVPQAKDSAKGASTFGDPAKAPLTGHYHAIAKDTAMPANLAVVADGTDVGGSAPETHHTIYATAAMTFIDFQSKFAGLPWAYSGSKK